MTADPIGNSHVLIVEDSATQAQRLQHILEQQGYTVERAADGRQALRAAHERKPALIISDVIMPEMDGYELCQRVKTDPALEEVPVILVTTLSDPGDVIRGLECRADNFILKPYDERYLLGRVRFVLVNRQMQQTERGGLSVEVFFNDRRHVITADRLQILNLLLSTYEAAIQRNKELTRAQKELTERGAALAESEQRMRGILDTAYDAFVGIDADGKIVEWNRAAEGIFGWSRAEVVGRRLTENIMPPQYREAYDAGLEQLRRTGEGRIMNQRVEVTALRRDGQEFPVEVLVWPLEIGGRRLYNAFLRDITERRRADAAVRQAKEEAERANHAKSDFVSRMSHDLRTPLNAILGFAQLLEMDKLSPEQSDNVQQILRAGAHLLDLINEVLDIARIESGNLALSLEPVSVVDVIQNVYELVRPLAAERGISITAETECARGLHVLADRQRLIQILLNLLSNAVKYNRERGQVIIRCEVLSGERLRIDVSDTGAGIPPDKLPLLFQPFQRLDAAESGIEGTGLGLALSKALAEIMGGRLDVQSEVDRGSTFRLELGLAEHVAAADARTVGVERAAGARDSGVTGTVLYIEDNVSNRRLMERLLVRRRGVKLIGVAQGQAGLDLARADPPDLILLDLHLADMRGEEVLRRLWEDPRTRAIPVAVLSADATPSQITRLLASGATAYLTKPLNIPEVLQLIDDKLKASPPEDLNAAAKT